MLKLTVLLIFTFSFIFASEFKEINEISLKKDELKKILVKYDDKEKLLTFRWTLYKNNGLVVFRSYDKIVAQNILYLRERHRGFRVVLKPRGSSYEIPFVLVRFKEFDEKKNKAIFEFMLSDSSGDINVEYLKK